MFGRGTLLCMVALGVLSCGEVGGDTNWDATFRDGFVLPDGQVQNDSTVYGDAGSCVTASYVAEQAPLAMIVVLDKSASMADQNRWNFAAQAIVQALDQDVFDTTFVGLYAAPSGMVSAPACISWALSEVGCAAPAFPQKALTLAGIDKSTAATGIRREIKDWLANEAPLANDPDGTPLYDAIYWSSADLQSWPQQGKRVLLVVTDGSISCTSLSTRNAFTDCNTCDDWEHPQNIVTLVEQLEQDATAPVLTFIVGVPGSDTCAADGCYEPPYQMRAALSSMALAGAPNYVSATCDAQNPIAPPGDCSESNPTESCHFDMTQGNFSVQNVADAISVVRGQTVGCTYALPNPPGGLVVTEVNVRSTVDGDVQDLARRSDPSNSCDIAPGCWDYDADQENVELIGAACEAVMAGQSVQVDVILGCQTIVM